MKDKDITGKLIWNGKSYKLIKYKACMEGEIQYSYCCLFHKESTRRVAAFLLSKTMANHLLANRSPQEVSMFLLN